MCDQPLYLQLGDFLTIEPPALTAWMGKSCMYCGLVFTVVQCAESERAGLTSGVCGPCLPAAAAEWVAPEFAEVRG